MGELTIDLNGDERGALVRLAQARGCSIEDLARQAVRALLDREGRENATDGRDLSHRDRLVDARWASVLR